MKEFPPPKIDGRRRNDLREAAVKRARSYTPELDPDTDSVATALLGLFAEIAEDVTERLDRTPEKHRVAFFDELGFDRDPPQPARLPLVFELAENLQENVPIPSGTQAVSEPEGDEAEQTFETTDDFEATPARLQEVYSAHPDGDAIFEHQAGPQAGFEPQLFSGENQQSHVLYLGHQDFFSLKREKNGDPSGVPEFDVRIDAPERKEVFEKLQWRYYGIREVEGESIEGWHQLGLRPQSTAERKASGSGQTVLRFTLPVNGEFVDTTLPKTDPEAADEGPPATGVPPSTLPEPDITEVVSKWIKCEPPAEGLPQGLFDARIRSISLSLPGLAGDITKKSLEGVLKSDPGGSGNSTGLDGTGAMASLGGTAPDMLLANDVPLPIESSKKLYPFGEVPRPLDAFYVGSEDVLTKKGERILLVFSAMESGTTDEEIAEIINSLKESGFDRDERKEIRELLEANPSLPNLSWEYWNGSGWDYLPNVEDNFTEEGWVGFNLPLDAVATTVAGHESHWIRLRVLEDGYVEYEETDDSNVWRMKSKVVPRFNEAWLFYTDNPSENQSSPSDLAAGDDGSGISTEEAPRAIVAAPVDGATHDKTLEPVRDAVTTPPEHVVAFNNLSYNKDVADRLQGDTSTQNDGWFAPFRRLPDETQAVYLGFNRALDDGWIQVLFSSEEKVFPNNFYPRTRWEYCVNSVTNSWTRLSARDGTDGLTRRGIIGLIFPEPTVPCELFGRERHWIRARLVGNQFQSTAEPILEYDGSTLTVSAIDSEDGGIVVRNRGTQTIDLTNYRFGSKYAEVGEPLQSKATVPPGESLVERVQEVDLDSLALLTPKAEVEEEDANGRTVVAADEASSKESPSSETPGPCGAIEPLVLATSPIPTESPPVLRGVYVNAGWADNVQTVTNETLGSSDGEPNQEFSFANQPVTDETVWVEELSALSEDARGALKDEHPEQIEERTDDSGEVTAFWIQWTRVEDFVRSGADGREYVLDRTAGEVTFGDGRRGKIPPRGEDNIRANYQTGGGVDGNVREGSVTALTSALPFVESVTNPEPGDGGANAEIKTEMLRRASQTLRDRSRAVTRVDFERLAKAASRELERVRCIPGMDRTGASRVGWVTVLIVPRSSARKPIPSPEVKARVEEELRRHAPAPLTGPSSGRIVVRGPSYVEVTVDTDLVASDDVSSIATLEETTTLRLAEFLHPLTGSQDGTGWRFGELPCISDFYALLEGVEGVDHVERLEVTFRGRDRGYTVTDDDRLPEVTEDTLVFSGTHEIQATGETTGATDQTEGIV